MRLARGKRRGYLPFPMAGTAARTGFYSGTFDPVTLGHLDVVRGALRLVDVLVIGIGVHAGKAPLFTAEDRMEMLRTETKGLRLPGQKIEVVTFDTLTVDAARAAKATVIFRGLRDFDRFRLRDANGGHERRHG